MLIAAQPLKFQVCLMNNETATSGEATPAQVSVTRLTVITLAYFIAGWLGLDLATVGSNITLIWLPTGIAVAALFRWGWRYWPAVWLGALAVNLLIGSTFWIALGISVGNTLAPVLSVAILKRWHFNPDISSWRDVPVFIVGGAFLGMLVSATGGVAALVVGGALPESAVGWAWLSWWLGDSVGVLVGGMAIITFNRDEFKRVIRSERWNELFVSTMAVAAVGTAWIIIPAYPLSHILLSSLVLVVLIWIALRLGPWPAAIALLVLSTCATLALVTGRGPFLDQNPSLAITKLWADIATFSIVTLLVSALIAERKQTEEKLHLAASVFTHAHEGIMITSLEGTIIDVNRGFTRITGYSREEVLGHNPRLFSSGHHDKEFYSAMWSELVENGCWSGEIWNRRKNGEIFIEHQTISAVHDALGKVQWYVALLSDITLAKEHERQLEHLAHYDALTTLPNRVLLADRLHHSLAQTQRRGQRLAVAYLDLDGFKGINDRHGHEAGDQLLIILATRMKQVLREGDTLARLGGDEFVAVLVDLDEATDSLQLLTRLLAATAEPALIGDLSLQVSASLGVTFYPQVDDVNAVQLLRQADQAMYQAKLAGKNCYHIFDADQDRSARGHHESLKDGHPSRPGAK